MAKARNRYRNDPKHDALARQAASIDAHREQLKRAQGKRDDAADSLAATAAKSLAAAQAMDRLAADTRAATAQIKSMGARITAMAAATTSPPGIADQVAALGVTEWEFAEALNGAYTLRARTPGGSKFQAEGYRVPWVLAQLRAAVAAEKKSAAARASTLPAPWDQLAPLGLVKITSVPHPVRGVAEIRATFANGAHAYAAQSELALAAAGGLQRAVDDIRREFLRMHPEEAAKLPKAEPVPKRTGKALGFRSWKLEGYKLRSASNYFGGGWNVGEPTNAVCFVRAHDAPDPNCQCGLYALHAPEFMSRWHGDDPLMVHGAVLGWGRMQVHAEGWRAEYAQPVMLAYDGERQTYNHCERVKALGSELGLPVVPWGDFEREARKFGEPVPDELRPKGAAGGYASGGVVGSTVNTLALRPIVGAQALKRCPHCLAVYTVWEGHCPSCGQ